MQRIVIFLLIAVFDFVYATSESADCKILIATKQVNTECFLCELTLSVPAGYKLPKAPYIYVLRSKNLKNFQYSEDNKKIDDVTYKTNFYISIDNKGIADNYLELEIQVPMCSDTCAIVSKKITVIFDYNTRNPNNSGRESLWFFLLLGCIGGLILNIMPCVLPVLLLKLRSFSSRSAILGSIAGNYVSFFTFAASIALLKIGGETIGWGFHFQNSFFLHCITLALFFLTLYSFEIVKIFPSVKIKNDRQHIFYSNFVSSIVASLIAIPCTAPFLGSAATFAIQGTTFEMCAVFFAIATGFSIPYLLSLFIPVTGLERFYKFGNAFKNFIDYGVLVAFLWVFWLLSNHINLIIVLMYMGFFAIVTFLFIKNKNIFASAVTVIFILSASGIGFITEKKTHNNDIIKIITPELIKNRVVILNITADWCMTCQYNKLRIFNNQNVQKAMKNNDVLYLEGDMTRKNDRLIKFINNHNRIGIPFTIVYGSKAPYGIMLKEIPTVNEIIDAINGAK